MHYISFCDSYFRCRFLENMELEWSTWIQVNVNYVLYFFISEYITFILLLRISVLKEHDIVAQGTSQR